MPSLWDFLLAFVDGVGDGVTPSVVMRLLTESDSLWPILLHAQGNTTRYSVTESVHLRQTGSSSL